MSAAMLVSGGGLGVCFFYLLYSVVVYRVEPIFCWGFFSRVFLPVGYSSGYFSLGDDGYIPLKKNFGRSLSSCKLLFDREPS